MPKKYKMPSRQNLRSRSSTISNAFAIAVTPYIRPDESELAGYYEALGIEEGKCAYCVVGDGNGRVGFGYGKAREVPAAIQNAYGLHHRYK